MTDVPHDAVPFVLNGRVVPTTLVNDFLAEVPARASSFITNFGNWQLPAAVEQAFHSPVGHLEWFHDTGELVLVGQVPHLGQLSYEVSRAEGAATFLGGLAGGGTAYAQTDASGATRVFFPSMVVSTDTLMAVLALIEHGPRVHELLWGWHREHRSPDGWAWLEQRLREHSAASAERTS